MSFFILGLPRSRTAWLANFMTYDGSFCYHEGINGCYSVDKYREKLKGKGDSTTGAALLDLDKYFPDSKKVIIESDPQKSIDYSIETYGEANIGWIHHLEDRLSAQKGLRVHYDDIDRNLESIWGYLTDKPFNYERAEMLRPLNIQVHNPYIFNMEAATAISHEFL